MNLTYIERFLTLDFFVAVCICTSYFASLVEISKWIRSSAIGLNIYAITVRIKSINQ